MKFIALSKKIVFGMEWVGILAAVIMIVVSFVNVIAAKIFISPMRGSTEYVSFSQILAISFVLAVDLFEKRHIAVDFLANVLSKTADKWLDFFVVLLETGFFSVLAYQCLRYGASLYRAGEISSGAYLPLYIFCYAIFIGCICALLYCISEIISIFTGRRGETNDAS